MDYLITIIPAYNAEPFLGETLNSVAAQKLRPDRVIVIDNGSTDGTESLVKGYRKISCEWQRNETNLGLFGNLNRALEWADKTTFLHILHADDIILPGFYQICTTQLAQVQERGMTYCCTQLIDEYSRPTSHLGLSTSPPETIDHLEDFLSHRAELRPLYSPSVLLKTCGLPSPCQFREQFLHIADTLFWAEWSTFCSEIHMIPEVLCQYRIHSSSVTKKNISDIQSWMRDEWTAMRMIEELRHEPFFWRWIRKQKLRCIFAARSIVKSKLVQSASPELSQQIEWEIKKQIPLPHRILGAAAVRLKYGLNKS